LYTKVTLVTYSINKLPSFTGFWSEDIPAQQQLQFTRQTIDGVQYLIADLKKVVLYPQRSGTLTLEPMDMEVIARIQVKRNRQSNDPFDMFFNNTLRDVKHTVKSEPVTINVKELPAASADCNFGGSVGKFNVEYALDKKETKTNEAITLKIKFSGKGNIKLIEAPVVQLPPDIESYDPKINERITVAAGGASGSKSFEYLLIPRKAGQYKIPLDAFCYFDIGKKDYVKINPPELVVNVERGAESGAATVSGTSKEDVRMLNKDIRFIKTSRLDGGPGKLLFLSPAFYMLQAFPLTALLLILFVRRKQIQQQSNIALMRSRKADSVARKRLKTAKKLLAANEKQKFLDEMFRALWGFVSDRLRIPVSELSRDRIREELTLKNISSDIISLFGETVDACEYARFAPASEDNRLEDIYDKGINVITGLDKSLR
jgi:hypothetical protein